jgi:hypothetical protein
MLTTSHNEIFFCELKSKAGSRMSASARESFFVMFLPGRTARHAVSITRRSDEAFEAA